MISDVDEHIKMMQMKIALLEKHITEANGSEREELIERHKFLQMKLRDEIKMQYDGREFK